MGSTMPTPIKPINIIYLNSHDTGRYIQPYGFAVPTPHLQELATQGVLLRNCHCGGPTCSPSRAALLTGQYPHCNGMLGLAHRGFGLTDHRQHLAWHLRAQGWHCVAGGDGGTNHCADSHPEKGLANGYETLLPGDPTAAAIEFLAKPHDRPFFLSLSYGLTHRKGDGFATPPAADLDGRWHRAPAGLPDTAAVRADWAHFCADARELDRRWGTIFAALDQAGLAENTFIIATTDHAAAFPYMKCQLTAQGTGVFCILRGPGFTGGVVVDALTSQIDIFPTICAVANIPAPDYLQGVSLTGTVAAPEKEIHTEIFSEVTWHAAYEPARAIRTPRHVYIERFEDRLRPVMPNCDESPSKAVCLAAGWTAPVQAGIYDSWLDPQEITNRGHDPAYAPVQARLRERLHRWMQATADPLLAGDPVEPAGVVMTPSNAATPKG